MKGLIQQLNEKLSKLTKKEVERKPTKKEIKTLMDKLSKR